MGTSLVTKQGSRKTKHAKPIYKSLKNIFLAYLKLWDHSKIVDLVIAVRSVPLIPFET